MSEAPPCSRCHQEPRVPGQRWGSRCRAAAKRDARAAARGTAGTPQRGTGGTTRRTPLGGGTTETLLKDRRILRDEGFITCIVVIDAATGKIAAGPEITARGFAEDDTIFDEVIPKVASE